MKLNTETILIVGLLAAAVWYFTRPKESAAEIAARNRAAPAAGPTAAAAALSETQQVLEGTAGIIEASGAAVSDVMQQIWPD